MKATEYQQSKHLIESDLLPEYGKCRFCSSSSLIRVACIRYNPEIYLVKCKNCHAVSASRMPKEHVIKKYYEGYYCNSNLNVTISSPKKFAQHIFNIINHFFLTKKTITILDFGGGDGAISACLGEKLIKNKIESIEISLIDYSNDVIKAGTENIKINKFTELSEIKGSTFDIIIASAIIEHIPAPYNDLFQLFSSIKKGGVIYFRTPYILPLYLFLKKFGLTIDFTYPGHVHDLGNNFWDNLHKWIIDDEFDIIKSTPSIVETSFKNNFIRTMLAYSLKAPWYLFGNKYNWVGGWEIVYRKK